MKPLLGRLASNVTAALFVLALSSTAVAPGCHLGSQTTADFKQCFGPDFKGDALDIAKQVGGIFLCEITSGSTALPACVISGMAQLAKELGPSGKADLACVANLLKNQILSTKTAANRDDVIRAQRADAWLNYTTQSAPRVPAPPGEGPGRAQVGRP